MVYIVVACSASPLERGAAIAAGYVPNMLHPFTFYFKAKSVIRVYGRLAFVSSRLASSLAKA